MEPRRRAAAAIGCAAGSGPPVSRTLLPCDPIFYHHTAILGARLHGALADGRADGWWAAIFG